MKESKTGLIGQLLAKRNALDALTNMLKITMRRNKTFKGQAESWRSLTETHFDMLI